MNKQYRIILLILMLAASSALIAQKNTTNNLVIYTEEFPPYNFTQHKQITGINIALVKAMCERNNIPCTFTMLPWNRAFRSAQTQHFSGLVSTARTPAREDLFKWVGPLASSQNCIYKLTSRRDIIVTPETPIHHYSIGVASDAAYTEILSTLGFSPNKNLRLYNGKHGNLKPFAAGRVDLLIASSSSVLSQLKIAGLRIHEITPIATLDTDHAQGNYLALNLSVSDEHVTALQNSLDKLKAMGEIQKIQAQFIKTVQPIAPANTNTTLWDACIQENQE